MRRRRKPSVFVPFVTRRKEFLYRDMRHRLTEFVDLGHDASQFGLTAIFLRYDPSNRFAMSCNDNGLAALDRIEQGEQTRLGLGCLNLAHGITCDRSM